ncbi:MAG TPA: hypothetical protein VEM60_03375 [Candidatus Dormibacteraeota bacterium]|nr:hypothetical protein [Candidatus Dormibacteraeota bacterium]
MAEQRQLTKGKVALLLALSAVGAIASRTLLYGWHIYLRFAVVGIGLFIGFVRWNRRY